MSNHVLYNQKRKTKYCPTGCGRKIYTDTTKGQYTSPIHKTVICHECAAQEIIDATIRKISHDNEGNEDGS